MATLTIKNTVLFTYNLKKILGQGDNAIVFLVERNGKDYALKVIKSNTSKIDNEISIQKKAAELGCAPKIYEDVENVNIEQGEFNVHGERAIVMEIIKTFEGADKIAHRYQKDLIQRTWILLQNGIIHNDLHQGNIGIRKEGRHLRGIIFDFGEAEVIAPPTNNTIIRQLMVSQLFSMLTNTGCNSNNSIDLCGDQPIHNAIYDIKRHDKDSLDDLDKLLGPDIDPRDYAAESMAKLTIQGGKTLKLKY